ncbi:hypothetical protein FK004_12530 [Flavobacterium kingsejongi]|uniref:Uncharacterized protein n=1 Tax=Flavobacterium kingsejongi TaxID=1678728 RepID=A0A2S1LQM6_9FLAO|nr:hypothetical protein FK004_12530 [Flavobacterium kingsejongi]
MGNRKEINFFISNRLTSNYLCRIIIFVVWQYFFYLLFLLAVAGWWESYLAVFFLIELRTDRHQEDILIDPIILFIIITIITMIIEVSILMAKNLKIFKNKAYSIFIGGT